MKLLTLDDIFFQRKVVHYDERADVTLLLKDVENVIKRNHANKL